MKQPEPLGSNHVVQSGDAGDVSPRPGEVGDEAGLDWIESDGENDWYCRGGRGRAQRWIAGCGDDSHPTADEIIYQSRQLCIVSARPAVFDRDILAVDVTDLGQAIAECRC